MNAGGIIAGNTRRAAKEAKKQTKLLEQIAQQQKTPAGWYACPQRPGWLRRWDGAMWTTDVAQIQAS
jgi:hypothetical protein